MDGSSLIYAYPPQDPRYAQAMADAAQPDTSASSLSLFGQNGLSFKDLIDTINPLQQLPVVGSIYRAVTGDTISTVAQMMGGALFGGPIGFITAAANAGLSAATGGGVTDHLIAMLSGPADTGTQYAASQYQKTQNLLG